MNATGLLLFGCGQLGMMALARFFFQWLLHFAANGSAPGLAAATVGAAFFAFRIFDGVTDPLAGALSDGWVRKGRERRALLRYSFLLPAIGLVLVFAPAPSLSPLVNWLLLGIGMFTFFVGYTLYAIPYWSLLDDYSRGPSGTDTALRATLSNVLGAGLLAATAVGFVASPVLVDSFGYGWSAILFAVPCAALMLLPYFSQPATVGPPVPNEKAPSLWQSFRLALTHRKFLAVIALFAGGQMSFTIMTAAAPFIATELVGGDLTDVAWLLGPFLGTALPSFALVPRLIKRAGWERSTLVATVMLGIVYGGTGVLGAAWVGTPLQSAMLVFAIGGPMAAVLLGLEGEAVIACASERGTHVTAVYFGVYNFVVKALNGVALLLTGVLSALRDDWGVLAVRSMGWLAGGLLFVGVLLYVAVSAQHTRGAAVG